MTAVLPLDQQLCFSLYGASMAISRLYKPMLDDIGITYPQYLVLHALWEEDGRTVGAIAQRLALESSTVTPLVKRLEATGLVVRERNPADERQVQVWLTPPGAALKEQCGCLGEALMARAGMEPAELMDLQDRVQRLWRALRDEAP